jgi:hypothetical protein
MTFRVHGILVGKPEGKMPLGRPRLRLDLEGGVKVWSGLKLFGIGSSRRLL